MRSSVHQGPHGPRQDLSGAQALQASVGGSRFRTSEGTRSQGALCPSRPCTRHATQRLESRRNWRLAEADARKALEENPNDALARGVRGLIAARRGDDQQCIAELTWAIDHGSDILEFRLFRGVAYEKNQAVRRRAGRSRQGVPNDLPQGLGLPQSSALSTPGEETSSRRSMTIKRPSTRSQEMSN